MKWTKEPPSVPGRYRIRWNGRERVRDVYSANPSELNRTGLMWVGLRAVSDIVQWEPGTEWSGPIPEPDDAAGVG